jgi:hypothetical protein
MIPVLSILIATRVDSFNPDPFPYGSATFNRFISDSQDRFGSPTPRDFYAWMDTNSHQSIGKWADRQRESLKRLTGKAKADAILKAGADLHALVKKTIPKFSLERGYEFYYTVTKGERQCFLQSVLISGILQRAGVDAGVVMVWKNEKGSESNLGHAVVLARNVDGSYFLVDASDPHPFMTHQGLFGTVGRGYRFVTPEYRGSTITGFADPQGGRDKSWAVRGLDANFLQSQFDFYRGERAEGGFMGTPRTPEGLQESAKYLERAVKECPQNPLAVYVLGHVYRYLGRSADAKRQYEAGFALYQADGYVPPGPRAAVTAP